jgi:hypothetical protein
MTVLNTNYTTLEEAWGEDFRKNAKQKSLSNKKAADPLCQLYGRKYQKARKPFLDKSIDFKNHRVSNEKVSKNRYFGFEDDRHVEQTRTPECVVSRPARPHKRPSTKKQAVRFNLETEDDDDVYLHNAVQEEQYTLGDDNDDEERECGEPGQASNNFYNDVYDESDDEQFDASTIKAPSRQRQVQHVDMTEIESEERNFPLDVLQRTNNEMTYCNQYKDERQYFDLIIYVLSGIILIFMMEQFIQIGMRLKMPNSPM